MEKIHMQKPPLAKTHLETAMIFDDVKLNDNRYSYKFYLCSNCKTGSISGRPIEKGDNWIRVRQSSTVDGEHNDTLIPADKIAYITEHYSRE